MRRFSEYYTKRLVLEAWVERKNFSEYRDDYAPFKTQNLPYYACG